MSLPRPRFVLSGTIAAFATLAGLSHPPAASAATFTYAPGATSDLWSSGANWTASAPVSAVDTRLTFVGTNTTVLPDALANINTDDLLGAAGLFQLNILDLQGTGPNTGTGTITINASAPGSGLSLVSNGATTPVVNLNALNGAAGLTYDITPSLNLANNTLFQGEGTATFNFSGGINGGTNTLTKAGTATPATINLGGATTLGSLVVGNNNLGGSIVAQAGSTISIGNGTAGQTLSLANAGGSNANGTLNASAASSVTINVPTIAVGITANSNRTGNGVLNLSVSNDITASTSFIIGNSGGAIQNAVTPTVTTAAGGTTTIKTPTFTIGGNKSNGTFTLGAGASVEVAGATGGTTRSDLSVSNMSAGGGSQTYNGIADFSGGTFRGNLRTLVVGSNTTASSTSRAIGTMTLGTSTTNHLDISNTGNVVIIGRQGTGANGPAGLPSAEGTLTIGNLDATSSITSTDNNAAIVIGSAVTAAKAIGTLNLNGGMLTITTSGNAILGGANGTSTVNFNGTLLRAGTTSQNWITGLTNARVSTGGALFDTNNNFVGVPQNLTHDPALVGADGGLTKSGGGMLALLGTNSYTGPTVVNGGLLYTQKTASLPNFATPGAISVAAGGGLALGVGGAGVGEFSLADLDTYRSNGTFVGSVHSIGIDTSNVGGDLDYANSGTIGDFAKIGANKLTLTSNPVIQGSLEVGHRNLGGTLAAGSGSPFSVGSGPANSVFIGGSLTSSDISYTATLDVSAASEFSANVGNFFVGNTGGGNPANTSTGSLILSPENSIIASTEFRVGRSENQPMTTGGTVTTGNDSITFLFTPQANIGTGKSAGTITLGTGASFTLTGVNPGDRTALTIGNGTIGTGTSLTASLNATGGTLNATLGNVVIGNQNHTSAGAINASLLLGNSANNHLDISGAGDAVIVGRKQTATGGQANGTLTIGNLDATSSITSTTNGAGIMLAVGALSQGTLNLDGGTLTITTTGKAIGGGTGNSIVNFNGTTLKAGATSTDWISGITTANVAAGGVKIDTNGNDVAVSQSLTHATGGVPDGGLTKSGAGSLTLSGVSSFDGPTSVNEGTLLVSGNIGASSTTVAAAGTLGGSGGTVGAVTVQSDGTIAPGASIGTLNSGTLTLETGARFLLEIDSSNVTGLVGSSDRLSITGDLNLGPGNSALLLTDLGADAALELDTKFTFITYTGTWNNNLFTYDGDAIPDGGIVALGANQYQLDYNDVNSVSLTVVPEPNCALALFGGVGMLVGLRRRRG